MNPESHKHARPRERLDESVSFEQDSVDVADLTKSVFAFSWTDRFKQRRANRPKYGRRFAM